MKKPFPSLAEGLHSADGREIDNLVDGLLGEERRSALLLKLDATPDGWKRCALAFLESQAFRDALAPLGRLPANAVTALPQAVPSNCPPGGSPAPLAVVPAEPATLRRQRKAIVPLFAAACAALAFWAGWALKPVAPGGAEFAQQPVTGAVQPEAKQLESTAVAQGPAPSPSQDAEGTQEGVKAGPPTPTQPVMAVALSESKSVLAAKQIQLRSLEEAIRQLEKKGYRADVQNQLVFVKTPDGRRVEMPIHELTLKYRGKQTY